MLSLCLSIFSVDFRKLSKFFVLNSYKLRFQILNFEKLACSHTSSVTFYRVVKFVKRYQLSSHLVCVERVFRVDLSDTSLLGSFSQLVSH